MCVDEAERSIAKYVMSVQELYFESPCKLVYQHCYRRGRPKCKSCDRISIYRDKNINPMG